MPTREEIANVIAKYNYGKNFKPFRRDYECADAILALPSPAPVGEWRPIETVPEGEYVTIWLPKGDRGLPTADMAMLFKDEHSKDLRFTFWTQGGPNSGVDWEPASQPTHWRPAPEPPARQTAAAEAREDGR